ncbi:unnamed protein product, partial [Ixodes hexagonus]
MAPLPLLWLLVLQAAANKCEIKGCPALKPGHITVHILAHSHNDAGWIVPVGDTYDKSVRHIYDTTTRSLLANPQRRYVSAENVFFSRWWKDQTPEGRENVSRLVQSGRLQFVGGGWTQNDEAVTHYTAIVDQMTLGLRFLNDTFGECGRPSSAWQADPFGHSRSQAALFAQESIMGFDGLMIGRISKDTQRRKEASREMEFVWQTDPYSQEPNADLFTWVPPSSYITPAILCVGGMGCQSPALYESTRDLPHYMLLYAQYQTEVYTPSNIAIMFGSDLSFIEAERQFAEMDTLVATSNELEQARRPRWRRYRLRKAPVHVSYSSPGCFLRALHELNATWPVFRDDLFPYTDSPGRTWTGFYTSRPSLKFFARYANGFLQACKQLSVLGGGNSDSKVDVLREAVATLQHHDGITGTSTNQVVLDYVDRLMRGITSCEATVGPDALWTLLSRSPEKPPAEKGALVFCHLLNISQCEFTESKREFSVLLYNPDSESLSTYVRFPVRRNAQVVVTGPNGSELEHQLIPVAPHRSEIPERTSTAPLELVFPATVPPLGISVYRLAPGIPEPNAASSVEDNFLELEKPLDFIENDRYRLELDPTSGLVTRVHLFGRELSLDFQQSFATYLHESIMQKEFSDPGHYVFSAYRNAYDLGDHVAYHVVK